MATAVAAQARTEKLLIHSENHGFKLMEMVGASSIVYRVSCVQSGCSDSGLFGVSFRGVNDEKYQCVYCVRCYCIR